MEGGREGGGGEKEGWREGGGGIFFFQLPMESTPCHSCHDTLSVVLMDWRRYLLSLPAKCKCKIA